MGRTSGDVLQTVAGAFTLVQLPLMLTLAAYYRDPLFSMYTTNMRNVTSREMDIEVEDFSASVLYVSTSAAAALFGLASRQAELDPAVHYTACTMEELPVWDMSFWIAVAPMKPSNTCLGRIRPTTPVKGSAQNGVGLGNSTRTVWLSTLMTLMSL